MTMMVAVVVLILLTVLLLASRLFYDRHLGSYGHRKLAQLGHSLKDVRCSLDRMIYLVPLPTYEEALRKASEADLAVEMDLRGWIFPELKGIRVALQGANTERQIAYVIADQFTSPTLDRLLLDGKLDRHSYGLVSRSLLVQPATLAEIRSTAHKRLQSGPYNPG